MSPHTHIAIQELEQALSDIHRNYENAIYCERSLQARKFNQAATTIRNAITLLKSTLTGAVPPEDGGSKLAC